MKLPNWIKLTPTIDTNVYAANDLVGPKLEFDLSAFADVDELLLNQVLILDRADQGSVTMNLVLFDEDPTNTTFADNDPMDIDDADMDKIIAAIIISAEIDVGGAKVKSQAATNSMRIPITLKNVGAQKIYGALMITSGTPTYSANSLTVKLGFEAVHRHRN